MSEDLSDTVSAGPSTPTVIDRYISFIQAANQKRFEETLKDLSGFIWGQLTERALVPAERQADARLILESTVLQDQTFFQAPVAKTKERISGWFTREDGLPPFLQDFINFLNQG